MQEQLEYQAHGFGLLRLDFEAFLGTLAALFHGNGAISEGWF
ncbi:MAG: hypothetical protein ACREHF_05100 [Rhizomicrobium sp.]